MFWNNFISLCQQAGKSPNAVARELSISSGSVTNWKNGKLPHNSTLVKIANYFGVTVEFLLGKEQQSYCGVGAVGKNYVIFHRDGKNITKCFTPEQMKIIEAIVSAMPEANDGDGEGDTGEGEDA